MRCWVWWCCRVLAFLELVLHAGGAVGCPVVGELALEVPLVLGERGGVQVQVVVGEPGEGGERPVEVYSRLEGASDVLDAGSGLDAGGVSGEGSWTRHASGVLSSGELDGGSDGVGSDGVGSDGVGEGWAAVDARVVELGGSWPPPGAGCSRSMTPTSVWVIWGWSMALLSRV